MFFFTFAFIGWFWEVLLHLITDGTFVNRGTMFGPWLPIYGFGGLLILLVLKPIKDKPILFFISTMILAGILEYSTAWYLETFKGMKWWDYTGYFLNIDGRICLEGLLIFAFGGSGVIYFVGPQLNELYLKIAPKVRIITCSILVFFFGTDAIYSSVHPNTGNGVTKSIKS
ncbi:MAG: putative ABC transporter permease [Bacilli bacterium]|nr:putative ABC transporter permease [Bacilli bacterium]